MLRAVADDWAQVLVLIRGGGSLEDLWAFNSAEVAGAIFASPLPVLTGVGHEVDVTIADMVADVRAATPSHAAQLLWPERERLMQRLDELEMTAQKAVFRLLATRERELVALSRGLAWLSPVRRLDRLAEAFANAAVSLQRAGLASLAGRQARLDGLGSRLSRQLGPETLAIRLEALERRSEQLESCLKFFFVKAERRLELAATRLESLDPKGPLARGYTLTTVARTGKILRRTGDVRPGDKLDIMVYDGHVAATVTGATPGDGENP
jgi:exodeoxyribonuclease VII large subunit